MVCSAALYFVKNGHKNLLVTLTCTEFKQISFRCDAKKTSLGYM